MLLMLAWRFAGVCTALWLFVNVTAMEGACLDVQTGYYIRSIDRKFSGFQNGIGRRGGQSDSQGWGIARMKEAFEKGYYIRPFTFK
jgi:hypothetical protein